MKIPKIWICSDAIGETAENVVAAAAKQFTNDQVELVRYGHVRTELRVKEIVREAADYGGFIAYTLVQPDLRSAMIEESLRMRVRAVDILGPMIQAYIHTFKDTPKEQPGLLHVMNERYFRKIDAIEFAVKYDDGKDATGLKLADIVIVGVSRTSKTPLCIFMAHKGIRCANYPLVPEIKPPLQIQERNELPVVGLTMSPEHLLRVRTERLKSVGLQSSAKYASLERIHMELQFAEDYMKQHGYPMIDVTDKSIEETAGLLMQYIP